jgi:hypothetical protein
MKKSVFTSLAVLFCFCLFVASAALAAGNGKTEHKFRTPMATPAALQGESRPDPGDEIRVEFYQDAEWVKGTYLPEIHTWSETELSLLAIEVFASKDNGIWELVDKIIPFSRRNVPTHMTPVKPERDVRSWFSLEEIVGEEGSYDFAYEIKFRLGGETQRTNRYFTFQTQPILFDGGWGWREVNGNVHINFYGVGMFGNEMIPIIDIQAGELFRTDVVAYPTCDDCDDLQFEVIYGQQEYKRYLSGRTVTVTFCDGERIVRYDIPFQKYSDLWQPEY